MALALSSLAWVLDRRGYSQLRAAALVLAPVTLLGGGYLLANQLEFGDATRGGLHRAMLPAFVRETPVPVTTLLSPPWGASCRATSLPTCAGTR